MLQQREARLAVVLVAAGSSIRMGFDKLWAPIAGQPLLKHVLVAVEPVASELIVVVKPGDQVRVGNLLAALQPRGRFTVTLGGPRRQDSVRNGLRAIAGSDWVAVHDAARPLVTPQLMEQVCRASLDTGAAIPALKVSDTIKRVDGGIVAGTIDRENLWAAQTPQVFETNLLIRAHEVAQAVDEPATDDARLVEQVGARVVVTPGEPWNLKITSPADIEMAECIISRRSAASSTGR